MNRVRLLALLSLLPLTLLVGCISMQTREIRQYVLSWHGEIPASFDTAAPREPTGRSIAVGPVIIPAYLQRSAIVTREEKNRIAASAVHTWGEPLESGVSRLLVESLVVDTKANRIAGLPWPFPGRPDLRVAVEILNFERDVDGLIYLVARWTVLEGQRATPRLVRRIILTQEIEGSKDYPALVDAMSRVVMTLGREIAGDIDDVVRKMDEAPDA